MIECLRYYGANLSGGEWDAYYAMSEGLKRLETGIRVPRLPYERLNQIFTMVKYDYPGYFFAGSPSYRAVPAATHIEFLPDYYFSLKDIPSLRAAADKRMSRLLSPAVSMSDPEKARFVWDFIKNTVIYEKLTRHYSHEIYGVLFHGIGVCEGIAKTAKAMLDRLSVESLVVLSDVGYEGTRHAWNVIWLYGKPRHYDFTFDLARHKDGLKPIYQNLTDEQIFCDHRPSVFPIPNCN